MRKRQSDCTSSIFNSLNCSSFLSAESSSVKEGRNEDTSATRDDRKNGIPYCSITANGKLKRSESDEVGRTSLLNKRFV